MKPRLEIHFCREERKWFKQGREYTLPKGEYWLNHCRSGIQLALQALELQPQTGVGMMVYNCHTVMNAIRQAGCKPVFVDITEGMTIDMEDLAKKREQMQVLIVTHLFGIINDVKAIKKRYPDLIIIEDCAHCFEHEIEGEFGVYSVGQGKFPSIGDGGLLKANSLESERIRELEDMYAALPGYTKKQERKLYVRLWMKAMMYSKGLYWLTRRMKGMRELGSESVREEVTIKKMSRGIANILAHKRDDYPVAVQERLQNAAITSERVRELGSECIIGENAFMAVVMCEEPEALKKMLAKRGIETETHFKHCIDWAKQFGYVEGSCPMAEKLVNHLLMVPTYF